MILIKKSLTQPSRSFSKSKLLSLYSLKLALPAVKDDSNKVDTHRSSAAKPHGRAFFRFFPKKEA